MGTKFNPLSGAFDLVNELGDNLTDIDGLTGNKGDLIVHNGTDWIDIAVGTNDYVLTADSAQSSGVKWAAASGGGITWNEETGTSATAAVNNGYIANNASTVTITLPATAAVGDTVAVMGKGAGGWVLKPASGDTIEMLGTSTGGSETVTPTEATAAIEVVCITANAAWAVRNATGNFTFA